MSTTTRTTLIAASLCCISTACGSGGAGNGAPGAPALTLEPCRLRGAGALSSIAADCGYLTVPENPAASDGATIELFVARIPALNRLPGDSAFTPIAGGPGQASTQFYADFAAAFSRIGRRHDVIIVDQRGTGRSQPLDCPVADDVAFDASPQRSRELAAECLAQLDGNPRFYTTSIAVDDLDRVRAALGYDRLDVYGVSYGTRVAQHYLRRYPGRVRTMILDGVLPPQVELGPDVAGDAQHALELMFRRCEEDADCAHRYPDLARGFAELGERLRAEPRSVALPHPVTGEPTTLELDHQLMAASVRLLSYSPASVSLLPLLLHEAYAADNYVPLAAQSQMALSSLSKALSEGMHNSVVCAEDVPFFPDDVDRAALAETYLGVTLLDGLRAVCEVWPRGPVDADFHEPVSADAPVLLLSGSADPVTPPRFGEMAAASLANARHIVAEGQGHGLLAVGCVPRLLARFVDEADPAALDESCVHEQRPAPFFLGFSGPAP